MESRARGWGGVIAAALLLVPLNAGAYCRTRAEPKEEKTAANYNPATGGGCKTKYPPLVWLNTCVGYSLHVKDSRYISRVAAADVISKAFTRWTGASCPMDAKQRTRPSIDVRDLGPVECAEMDYVSGAGNQNVIAFRDDDWPFKKEDGVLGLTTVNFSPSTGEIYSADMEINTRDMREKLEIPTNSIEPDEYDFLSIVTHEAGHFLGFAHSDVRDTVMYADYKTGQTYQRTLAPDDVLGICEVYRPDGKRIVLEKELSFEGRQCNPTPRGGFSSTCQERPGARCDASVTAARPDAGLGVAVAAGVVGIGWLGRRRRRDRGGIPRG